jgi:hypothetical protein
MSNGHKYLSIRFAVCLLNDLGITRIINDQVLFEGIHFRRGLPKEVTNQRGSDSGVRIALAVWALMSTGLPSTQAAHLAWRIIKNAEKRTRRLARQCPSRFKALEFPFGKTKRGRRNTVKRKQPTSRRRRASAGKESTAERTTRFAELEAEMRRDGDEQKKLRRKKAIEKRHWEPIRVEAYAVRKACPDFGELFARTFAQFCRDRDTKTRTKRWLEVFEEVSRNRVAAFEENVGPGELITISRIVEHGLILHELGRAVEAIGCYELAAQRLQADCILSRVEYARSIMAQIEAELRNCRAGNPPMRKVGR